MSGGLVPRVTVDDTPVGFWARRAVNRDGRWLGRPDGLLIARLRCPYMSPWSVSVRWRLVTFMVGGGDVGTVAMAGGRCSFATWLMAGRHSLGVEPISGEDIVEPVTLEIRRGTIVLVEVEPETRPWAGGRAASVGVRVLPSGLAQSGRWGARWINRLGWDGPSPESGGVSPELPPGISLPDVPTEPLAPEVTFGSGPVPFWARTYIWAARRELGAPDCLAVVRLRCMPPAESAVATEWASVMFAFGDRGARELFAHQDQPGFAAGLAAGPQTFEVLPSDLQGFVTPVTLDLERGTVVLIDVRPRNRRWVGGQPPAVSVRVLPSALSGRGRWEERWRRRLGWEGQDDLTRPEGP